MNTQFSLGTKIKVGIIGFGRMGRFYWDAMRKSGRWDIAYICDTNPASRELAKELSPESYVIEDNQKIFEDESVQVVGLFTEGGNLAASKIRNLECPSYEICLIDYGCGKFNRKIHIMEQYP